MKGDRPMFQLAAVPGKPQKGTRKTGWRTGAGGIESCISKIPDRKNLTAFDTGEPNKVQ